MGDLLRLPQARIHRVELYFPLSHGVARVDDRRGISGIIFVIRNGLRWQGRTAHRPTQDDLQSVRPLERLGMFNKMFAGLTAKDGKPHRLMIDAPHLKAHRTAASLLKKGLFPDVLGARRAA